MLLVTDYKLLGTNSTSAVYSTKHTVNSPQELSLMISSITDELVQLTPNNTFSSDIINIRIEGNNVPDLSIVDLPGTTSLVLTCSLTPTHSLLLTHLGIIRTTTVGQTRNVITEVDSLLESFIKQARTIILAVIPANQDVATIDVLERAAKFDPMGSRYYSLTLTYSLSYSLLLTHLYQDYWCVNKA